MNLRRIIAWAAAGLGAAALIGGAILAMKELSARKTEAMQLQEDIGRLRSRAEEAEKRLEELRAELGSKETTLAAEIRALGERNQTLTTERDSLAGARDSLTAERDAAAREIEDLKGKLAAKTGETEKLLGSLDAISGFIAELRSGFEELKGLKKHNDLLAAEVERLGAELRQVSGKLAEAESQSVKLREERGRLEVEVQRMSQEVAFLRRPGKEGGETGPGGSAPPARETGERPAGPIEAIVDAVDNEKGLVVLGIGTASGVREAMVFTIHRGEALIATVKTTKVYRGLTGCAILRLEPGQEVRLGDKAISQSP